MILYYVLVVAVLVTIGLALVAILAKKPWLAAPAALPVLAAIVTADGTDGGGLLVFVLTALGVIAGSPIVALVLRLATSETVELGSFGGILVKDTTSPPPQRSKEVLRGGATIGYLERFALIGTVLVGQPAAVAIIVAIKGLGRFSELESSQARERFIIGTLASLAWAGTCATAAMLSW